MRSPSLARLFARRPRLHDREENRWPPLAPDLRLEGPDVWLRWPRLADAEAVFAYASDEAVSRFMDWRPHQNVGESSRFLSLLEQNRHLGREAAFGIIEASSGEFVGICSLLSQMNRAHAEIGYALRRNVWGKGYMTQAVRLISDWAFPHLQLQEIFADVHPQNVSSQRVLEKSGYVRLSSQVNRTIKGVNSPHYRYGLKAR